MELWPTILMAIELLVFEYLFCRSFNRRSYPWLKLLGGAIAVLVLVFWIEVIYFLITGSDFGYGEGTSEFSDSVFRFLYYFIIYLFTIGVMVFTFKESLPQTLLACCGGYAIQHLSFNVYSLFALIPFPSEIGELLFHIFIRTFLDVLCFVSIFYVIKKNQASHSMYQGNQIRKLILSFVAILLCIGLSRLANDDATRGLLATFAECFYAIVACSLILALLFGINESDVVHSEVDVMKEMLHQEKEQYALSKQNIELINIKCHDLKHQIAALRQNASEENIAEIEHAIMIYDTSIKTGNDVLDVILREKALQCESEHIILTCMVQGELISFMDTLDIYSFFGNILSNAIEATRKIKDADKRIITINARKVDSILSLHCENYYEADLSIVDDLPQTTKTDKDNHGFGMKSIKRTVEKYHGAMNIDAANGRFSLDFVFPL